MAEATKAAQQREMTDEDFQALMDADVWLDGFNAAGGTRAYQGMWIAVYGEQVAAADADKKELYRQLGALGDSINRFRVLVRYVHTLEELYLMP